MSEHCPQLGLTHRPSENQTYGIMELCDSRMTLGLNGNHVRYVAKLKLNQRNVVLRRDRSRAVLWLIIIIIMIMFLDGFLACPLAEVRRR